LAIVKSEIIKQLKKSYPNFELKTLTLIVETIIKEMKDSIIRGERVEIRKWGTLNTRIQKSSIRRNPKTGQKVSVPAKKVIRWRMSKELSKKLNEKI
tara:strand:+ start:913 stop:1203 length:291 start_codon:yes stop_codon:yes gene_type:complete